MKKFTKFDVSNFNLADPAELQSLAEQGVFSNGFGEDYDWEISDAPRADVIDLTNPADMTSFLERVADRLRKLLSSSNQQISNN